MTTVRHRPSRTTPDPQTPYLGLQAFLEEDLAYFFGRETEQQELVRLVRRFVLTVVFGASGVGKSSLLHAGLFPRVRSLEFLPISIRVAYGDPNADPIAQLKARITAEAARWEIEAPVPGDEETLWEYLHRARFWNKRNRLVIPLIVLDQFEENFTLGLRDPRRETFLEELGDVIENRIPRVVRERTVVTGEPLTFDYTKQNWAVIVAIREDFLPQLEDLSSVIPSLTRNRMRVTQMNLAQARRAVLEPGQHIVTEDAADAIVRFTAGARDSEGRIDGGAREANGDAEFEVEPALLSLLCQELNEVRIRQQQETITIDLIRGARDKIVVDFYERALEGLGPGVPAFIEERLLTDSGFRTAAALDEAKKAPDLSLDIINDLIARRLLRSEERLGIPHIELIHDVLVDAVRESRDERRRREMFFRRRRQWLIGGAVGVLLLTISLIIFALALRTLQQAEWIRADAVMRRAESVDDPFVAALLLREVGQDGAVMDPFGAVRVARAALGEYLPGMLLPHQDEVRGVAFSPDGSLIATASFDSMVRVWNVDGDGTPLLEGRHRGAVRTVAFNNDGSRLVTSSEDHTAVIWDTTGERDSIVLRGHTSFVLSATFSPDGRMVASTSADGTARLWSVDDGSSRPALLHLTLTDNLFWVWSGDFDPSGGRLVTASQASDAARVWTIDSGSVALPHPTGVNHAMFSASGQLVATGSTDGIVRIWDMTKAASATELLGHTDAVWQVAFDSRGRRLVTSSYDHTARVWDVIEGTEIALLEEHRDTVWTAAFSPDENRVLTTSSDQTARVWNIGRDLDPYVIRGHRNRVRDAAWSPDGRHFVTASADGTARVWHSEPHLDGHAGEVLAANFDPSGHRIVTGSTDSTAMVWTRGREQPTAVLRGHRGRVVDASFSSDGRWIITASTDSTIRIWNPDASTPAAVQRYPSALQSAVLSPDGTQVLTLTADGAARIWNRDGQTPARLLSDSVFSASFSSDGMRVVAAHSDRQIGIWDRDGNGPLTLDGGFRTEVRYDTLPNAIRVLIAGTDGQLGGHMARVTHVSFSPDGSKLLSVSLDGTARVWRSDRADEPLFIVEGGEPVRYRTHDLREVNGRSGHTGRVTTAAFSADNRRVVTGSVDGTVLIWSFDNVAPLTVLSGAESPVTGVAFAPRGDLVAAVSADGFVRVWNANRGGRPIELGRNYFDTSSIGFSPSGDRLLSVHQSSVRIWWLSWRLFQDYLRGRSIGCLNEEQRMDLLQEGAKEAATIAKACPARGPP